YFTLPHIIHMDSTGLQWTSLYTGLSVILNTNWTPLDCQPFSAQNWTPLDWTVGPTQYKTGLHWTPFSTQNWTGLDW
ncbi:hypothetical protein K443DRAFT_77406, partial [Laccaria amethystina LaAM-08-1]